MEKLAKQIIHSEIAQLLASTGEVTPLHVFAATILLSKSETVFVRDSDTKSGVKIAETVYDGKIIDAAGLPNSQNPVGSVLIQLARKVLDENPPV